MKLTCKSCLFSDQCKRSRICNFYSPATDEAEDEVILRDLTGDREEFIEEWKMYTEELYTEAFC